MAASVAALVMGESFYTGARGTSAVKIIDQAAAYIGIGLSMALNVLDPDRVILCGGLMRNGPRFFETIMTNTQKHRMRQSGRNLTITTGVKGEYSTAAGACRILANTLWQQRTLPI